MNRIYNLETKEITIEKPHRIIKFLYQTTIGRCFIKLISLPFISKLFSFLTNTKISCLYINHFIKKNHINMTDYEVVKYQSFNDFFTRKIKKENRPFSSNPQDLIAPCDSLLTVYNISQDTEIEIKNSLYTINQLIQDQEKANSFENGICLVFRLCVDNYHRYNFIDDGVVTSTKTILGKLHTVNPIALASVPVFKENNRVVSYLSTDNFNDIIYIEVGALNVGKIHNHPITQFRRGQEKGYFSFGASTIILLFPQNTIKLKPIFYKNTNQNIETIVKQGDTIGQKIRGNKNGKTN